MDFVPKVGFITPVFGRHALTKVCLEQRRAMIDALPFPAQAYIVGDEGYLEQVASDLDFVWVESDNKGVGRKFNAGYRRATADGCTHLMAVGSDSWLHPDALSTAPFSERGALGLIGLSSVSPYGDERLDLEIKYPAGFGVGMVYPAWAIRQGGGAAPDRMRGIDSSTWSRCGRGRVQIQFLDLRPQAYVNFHSPGESITDYKAVLGTHRRKARIIDDPWADLEAKYGQARVAAVQEVYALHAIGVFLTGRRTEGVYGLTFYEKKRIRQLPGHKGRDPVRRLDGSVRPKREQPNPVGGRTYTEIVENFRALTE